MRDPPVGRRVLGLGGGGGGGGGGRPEDGRGWRRLSSWAVATPSASDVQDAGRFVLCYIHLMHA